MFDVVREQFRILNLNCERNKRVRPTCLARGEECRGTYGQLQRYSLHASPVQRSNNPVTPSLTTKTL